LRRPLTTEEGSPWGWRRRDLTVARGEGLGSQAAGRRERREIANRHQQYAGLILVGLEFHIWYIITFTIFLSALVPL
jgi:hypothetical protein